MSEEEARKTARFAWAVIAAVGLGVAWAAIKSALDLDAVAYVFGALALAAILALLI